MIYLSADLPYLSNRNMRHILYDNFCREARVRVSTVVQLF